MSDETTNPDNRSPLEQLRDDMRENLDVSKRHFELTMEIREGLARDVEQLKRDMEEVKKRLHRLEHPEEAA